MRKSLFKKLTQNILQEVHTVLINNQLHHVSSLVQKQELVSNKNSKFATSFSDEHQSLKIVEEIGTASETNSSKL